MKWMLNHTFMMLGIVIVTLSSVSLSSCGGDDVYDSPDYSDSTGTDTTTTGGGNNGGGGGTGGDGATVLVSIDFTDICMDHIQEEGLTCHQQWYIHIADGLNPDIETTILWDLSSSPEGSATFSNIPQGSYEITISIDDENYVDDTTVFISDEEADQGATKSKTIIIQKDDYWCG